MKKYQASNENQRQRTMEKQQRKQRRELLKETAIETKPFYYGPPSAPSSSNHPVMCKPVPENIDHSHGHLGLLEASLMNARDNLKNHLEGDDPVFKKLDNLLKTVRSHKEFVPGFSDLHEEDLHRVILWNGPDDVSIIVM